jgi:glycosyltransferase involved in cell wall biosynthesis
VKISIITVVLNSESTIRDAIDSVLSQTYGDIEYIVIDGVSVDGTVEIIKSYGDKISRFASEEDNGLYDAMNKGIDMATGDIIGILNSDDFYIDGNVIEKIVKEFSNRGVDSVFSNLIYVSQNDINKTIRYFDSGQFKPSLFSYGLMPAHPTFFVKKSIYKKYGKFYTDMKNAADFDLLARFLYVNKISYYYIDETLVKMRMGGASTSFSSIWTNNVEILGACKVNGIKTNIFKIFFRYIYKFIGVFNRG